MGRTNPTYRDALRAVEERWTEFRRALRRRDRPRFDRLFDYARDHADASGLLNHQTPLLPALLSIDPNTRRASTATSTASTISKRRSKHGTAVSSNRRTAPSSPAGVSATPAAAVSDPANRRYG